MRPATKALGYLVILFGGIWLFANYLLGSSPKSAAINGLIVLSALLAAYWLNRD
jgi:hypothetical protein